MTYVISVINMVQTFLFGKLRVRDSRDELHFPAKIKLSSQIQINALFENNYKIKRSICDRNIHKAMWIPVEIYQNNNDFFVTVQPKNGCKMRCVGHLWLQYLDQPQSENVIFAKITF